MTLFETLNPKPSRSRSAITVTEVKEGLQYEVILVLNFVKFSIATVLWIVSWFQYPVIPFFVSLFFLLWSFLISVWRPDRSSSRLSVLKAQALSPTTYLPVLLLAQLFLHGTYAETLRESCNAIALGNMIYCIGFHPDLRLFIHVPLGDRKVLTGIFILILLTAVYQVTLTASVVSFSYKVYVYYCYVFCIAIVAAATIAFAAKAAILAAESQRIFQIFSPITDVYLSTKSVLNFRTETGLRVSSFLRLLEAQAADEESPSDTLEYQFLIDWLDEERGVAAWNFLCCWKQVRLGRRFDESEDRIPSDVLQAINIRRMTEHLQNAKQNRDDQPIRSPLLRGY